MGGSLGELMSVIPFHTPAQHERLLKMQSDWSYRIRVADEVATPLVKARDQARDALRDSLEELGVPKGANVVIAEDGVHFAAEGQEWDAEKKAFVEPASEPAEEPE
jgi:hypothetical protein